MSDEIWRLTPVERMEARRLGERLALVYDALRWKWGADPGRIPDAYDIERAIVDIAERAIKNNDKGVCSGGLRVTIVEADPTCDASDRNNPDNHLRFFVEFQP